MDINLSLAAVEHKHVITNLMQLYQYDYSSVDELDVNDDGCFAYPYLETYWMDPERHAFLVRVDGRIAGFVLVNRHTLLSEAWRCRVISEFFIMRKYRRRGVGERVARMVFNKFPGEWEIQEPSSNPGAQSFWRKVLDRYTGQRYREVILDDAVWRGPIQHFDNRRHETMGGTDGT